MVRWGSSRGNHHVDVWWVLVTGFLVVGQLEVIILVLVEICSCSFFPKLNFILLIGDILQAYIEKIGGGGGGGALTQSQTISQVSITFPVLYFIFWTIIWDWMNEWLHHWQYPTRVTAVGMTKTDGALKTSIIMRWNKPYQNISNHIKPYQVIKSISMRWHKRYWVIKHVILRWPKFANI